MIQGARVPPAQAFLPATDITSPIPAASASVGGCPWLPVPVRSCPQPALNCPQTARVTLLTLNTTTATTRLRKATIADVPRVQKLVNFFADRNEMLHKSLNELYENLRDFTVAEEDGEILACAAVHVTWDDLAELKSVAVSPNAQGRGLGKQIVNRCLDEARELGLGRVFALTYKPEFFERHGFRVIDRNMLPHKVWGECIKCHKFPNCNEVAMMCHLGRRAEPGA